jgi:nucleoid-associated protein YgaU
LVGHIESAEHPSANGTFNDAPTSTLATVATTVDAAMKDDPYGDRPPGNFAEVPRTHKVRDGDTLSELARRYLGRRERFMEIFEANRDKLSTPDLLPIGKELRIPATDEKSSWPTPAAASQETSPPQPDPARGIAPEPAASLGVIRPINGPLRPPRTYRVQGEQTLVEVAERVYGDTARYLDLYDANRDRLDSPQNLRPGMILFVP